MMCDGGVIKLDLSMTWHENPEEATWIIFPPSLKSTFLELAVCLMWDA